MAIGSSAMWCAVEAVCGGGSGGSGACISVPSFGHHPMEPRYADKMEAQAGGEGSLCSLLTDFPGT